MSSRERPTFDALSGAPKPFDEFGPLLGPDEVGQSFETVLNQASSRLLEVFQFERQASRADVAELEQLIARMWDEGWTPEGGDVDLFTRDLGAVLASAILRTLGGELLFRSRTDLSDSSIWWPERRLEAFPFHKIFKRLSDRQEASLLSFYDGLWLTLGKRQ